MNVVILEDELPAARALERILRNAGEAIDVIATLGSVAGAVEWFSKNPSPDLAFMDIQLGDGLSFELFEKADVKCPVVFTTAYDEYAIRAFKLNSIDYLLKPIDPGELAQSLSKFNRMHSRSNAPLANEIHQVLKNLQLQHQTYKSRFLVPGRHQFLSIPVEEISHFRSEHKNTYLVTREMKRHVVASTLEVLEEELDPLQFFRANRQYLVGYRSIVAVRTYYRGKLKAYLRGTSEEVVVSRERAGHFKKWLDR
jgi:DNA-binding LytR/AlgR family response regulator